MLGGRVVSHKGDTGDDSVGIHDPSVPRGSLPAHLSHLCAVDERWTPDPHPRWHGALRAQLHKGPRAPWHTFTWENHP